MLTSPTTAARREEAIDQVRAWVRARFRLSAEAPIRVSEVECRLPGCAGIETLVAFWTEAGERRQFKIFKPVAAVSEDDLPPAWMKDRLVPMDDLACGCC